MGFWGWVADCNLQLFAPEVLQRPTDGAVAGRSFAAGHFFS